MKISVLCSDAGHPIYPRLQSWAEKQALMHSVQLVTKVDALAGGDVLFLVSCHDLISASVRAIYQKVLVLHASRLPAGRGWSPHIWQILAGTNRITVSLLEAAEQVDCGAILNQRDLVLDGHELYDEINEKLFLAEFELMESFLDNPNSQQAIPQDETGATFYRRRTPEDSRIEPARTLAEQFDILRVADPERYPAFFDWQGHRYHIQIKKADKS